MTYLLREVTNEYRRINRNNRIRIRIIYLQSGLTGTDLADIGDDWDIKDIFSWRSVLVITKN